MLLIVGDAAHLDLNTHLRARGVRWWWIDDGRVEEVQGICPWKGCARERKAVGRCAIGHTDDDQVERDTLIEVD